ncbi:MAG TPA: homoserine kinase [Sutterella sp.]|nr:homoserine kinase [Sutterella sp.]
MKVTVTVPASTANLGPGFDCLGMALTKYATLTFESAASLEILGCPEAYRNDSNLVYRAFASVFEAARQAIPGVRITIASDVPIARGLGSSSTCIVAGIAAGRAFAGLPEDKGAIFSAATAMEGHPDNAAAAIFGGLTASFMHEGAPFCVPYEVQAAWRFPIVIPNYEVKTAQAREVLPASVTRQVAVHSVSHALGVVRALETGDEALLTLAAQDVLHEPYRRSLIGDFEGIKAIAKEAGLATLLISGSGSTLIGATRNAQVAEAFVKKARAAFPQFEAQVLNVCRQGLVIKKKD